jgi:hypothetical protein
MFSEGCTAHQVGYNKPLQIEKAIWRTFFFEFELAGLGLGARCRLLGGWRVSNFKKCAKQPLLSAVRLPYPTRSLS